MNDTDKQLTPGELAAVIDLVTASNKWNNGGVISNFTPFEDHGVSVSALLSKGMVSSQGFGPATYAHSEITLTAAAFELYANYMEEIGTIWICDKHTRQVNRLINDGVLSPVIDEKQLPSCFLNNSMNKPCCNDWAGGACYSISNDSLHHKLFK